MSKIKNQIVKALNFHKCKFEKFNNSQQKTLFEFACVIDNFEIEGSIEIVDNDEVAYSVIYYDTVNDIEYDAIIGTMNNNANETIEQKIKNLLIPKFVELK